jgi:hypothetical protein
MKEQWEPTIGDKVIHSVSGQKAKIIAFGKYERSAILYTCNNTGCFHFDTANIFDWELDNSSCTSPEPLSLTSPEEITKPERYNKKGTLECWDVILDQEMDFLEGSVLKYLWRYKEKNKVHDLEKAKVYIDKIIEGLKK